MKSTPLILNSADDEGRALTRIESRVHDEKSEAWLQELLFTHPELLPVSEFDDTFAPAIPIGREVSTESGPIDNLYVSPEGGLTVVETKLWKNPEKHRTVVVQIIDYAKELATWDYDRLCERVLTASRRRGEETAASFKEKIGPYLPAAGMELHEFQEGTASCLESGSFLLLIVGDRISPNLALMSQAIQSAPGLGFRIGLAEMRLYELTPCSAWPLIVVPEVVGRTVERTRGVVQVRYSQEKPNVEVAVEDAAHVEGSPSKKLDLQSFFQEIPKDLIEPFKDGIAKWEQIGGEIVFTNRMMFFRIDIRGSQESVVRCRTNQISTIRRRTIERWGTTEALYEAYLDTLDEAPVVCEHVRTGGFWIKYDTLSAHDLEVLLRAARQYVQGMTRTASDL